MLGFHRILSVVGRPGYFSNALGIGAGPGHSWGGGASAEGRNVQGSTHTRKLILFL